MAAHRKTPRVLLPARMRKLHQKFWLCFNMKRKDSSPSRWALVAPGHAKDSALSPRLRSQQRPKPCRATARGPRPASSPRAACRLTLAGFFFDTARAGHGSRVTNRYRPAIARPLEALSLIRLSDHGGAMVGLRQERSGRSDVSIQINQMEGTGWTFFSRRACASPMVTAP